MKWALFAFSAVVLYLFWEAAEEMDRPLGITNYYDSLTEEEVAESNAWGEFAESQLEEEMDR